MFNKKPQVINHHHHDRTVAYEKTSTVNHNYATTSEQAKHLEELQEKARSTLLQATVLQFNGLEFGAAHHTFERRPEQMVDSHFVTFQLNGRVVEKRVDIQQEWSPEKTTRVLVEKIAEEISAEVTQFLLHNLDRQMTFFKR